MAIDNFRRVDFTLDKANGYIPSDQFAKENDNNGRELTVQITDGGVIKDQSSLVLTLAWKHDTAGNEGQTLFTRLNGGQGIFTVAYDNAMMIPGTVTACIQIADGSRLTNTRNFKLRIEDNPLNVDKVVAEDSFKVFVDALAGLGKYDGRISALESEKAEKSTMATELGKKADKTEITALRSETDTKLSVKRNTATKIKRADMDTSSDANKLGLLNLSEEVQKAMAGTAPVIPSVPDGSITNAKVADKTLTVKKILNNAFTGHFIFNRSYPNYDLTTETLFIPGDDTTKFTWGNQTETLQYNIPTSGLYIKNNVPRPSDGIKLVFNSDSLLFELIKWDVVLTDDQVFAFAFRIKREVPHKLMATADFPIMLDHVFQNPINFPTVKILMSDKLPNIDKKTKTLVFPSARTDIAFICDGITYGGVVPSSGLTLNLPSPTTTTAFVLVFDIDNKSLGFDKYSNLSTYSRKESFAIVGTLRIADSDYILNIGIPYTVDGALYGITSRTITNEPDAPIKSIAHRGYQPYAPENTLIAFTEAKRHGYSYVECDIVFTKDGIPILSHDLTIARCGRNLDGSTVDPDIAIADLNYSELANYDFGIHTADVYRGTKMPSFEEFIILCKKINLRPYLDLKAASASQLQVIYDVVKKHNMLKFSTFISPDFATLIALFEVDNSLRLGYDGAIINQTVIDNAKKIQGSNNEVVLDCQQERLTDTPSMAALALENGFTLETWTMYDTAKLDHFVELGVSGFTNNMVGITEYFEK